MMGDNRQDSPSRKVTLRVSGVLILLLTSYFLWDFSRKGFDFYMIFMMGVLLGGISIGLLYLAYKPSQKSRAVEKPEISESDKDSFKFSYRHNEIFVLAILHEGYLPVTQGVTARQIAEEILSVSQSDERLLGIRLSKNAIIEMKRADESKYWQEGVYEPTSELRDLLDQCMDKVKQMYDMGDPVLNKVAARLLTFKSHSKIVGTVYVSMYILI